MKKAILAGVGAMALLLVGTAANAVISGRVGSFTDHQRFIHQTDAWSTAAGAFVDVPGATTVVTVRSGTRAMIGARFSAESQCGGTAGWCSVRIVLVRPDGSLLELNPQSNADFAFDSAGDLWESHAIERTTPFLAAGNYRVKVQAGTVAGSTSIRLDDWTLAVERIRP